MTAAAIDRGKKSVLRPAYLVLFLLSCFCTWDTCFGGGDSYEEALWIRKLPSGHIHTRMEFTVERDLVSSSSSHAHHHTTLFPRSLEEILSAHSVEELVVSLTQGLWRLESWGEGAPAHAAPTGAHVVTWFSSNSSSSSRRDTDANWRALTNRLSGLTCASLNFLDEATSIEPVYAFRPEGNFLKDSSNKDKVFHLRVGSLPKEFICTENLTPWTKLLPCGVLRGIASLLRSKQVFNTHYHSASLRYVKPDGRRARLVMELSLVFDMPQYAGQHDNFVKIVMGSMAIFPCHPATRTNIRLWKKGEWRPVKPEELNSLRLKDVVEDSTSEKALIFTPMRYMGGYGQEYGKMIVEMTNHLSNSSLSVLYVEVLPWYIRPYLHTIEMKAASGDRALPLRQGDRFHYTPGHDRKTLHKLEMDLQIPPNSQVTLSFMVEKGHLKWDEYPPDANHGFYLEAAHFEVNVTDENIPTTRHYYSRILLVNLSTPDFSMPYNVICLTCTVVALAFGPIHNITTKRLQLKLIAPRFEKIKRLLKSLWNRITKKKDTGAAPVVPEGNEDATATESKENDNNE